MLVCQASRIALLRQGVQLASALITSKIPHDQFEQHFNNLNIKRIGHSSKSHLQTRAARILSRDWEPSLRTWFLFAI